jgi:hypothetical protein
MPTLLHLQITRVRIPVFDHESDRRKRTVRTSDGNGGKERRAGVFSAL